MPPNTPWPSPRIARSYRTWLHLPRVPQVLLDTEGCDIEARDACGHTALMLASLRGHLSVMRTLVEAGAQDDGSDPTMLMDEDRSAPVKMLI